MASAVRVSKHDVTSTIPYLWNAVPKYGHKSAAYGSTAELTDSAELQRRYERGYRDGEAAGKEAKADAVMEELAETINSLVQTRAALFQSAQGDVLRLAMAVARRILHREILMSPDVIRGVIAVAMERIEEGDLHTLRVHPSFVARVQEYLSGHTSGNRLEVVGDPSLPLGGCIFETQHGNVDAGIESQLSEIERGLADHLEGTR